MDEEQGKVIDVTARARQWRGSRSRPSPEADSDEARSNAPKSLASSLLVPAEMLEGALAPPPGEVASPPSDERGVERQGAEGEEPGAVSLAVGGDDRNPFLSPGAAIIEQPPRRRKFRSRGVLRSMGRDLARLRGALRSPDPRTFGLPRPSRLAVAVALVAVLGVAAGLLAQSQTPSRTSPRAHAGPAAIAELGGLKAAFLSSIARALAATEAAGRSRPDHARSARRTGGHKPAIAHKAPTTESSRPVSASYTPTPTTSSNRPVNSGGATSNGSGSSATNGAQSTTVASPASASGGSTTALGSSGVLGPGSSPNG